MAANHAEIPFFPQNLNISSNTCIENWCITNQINVVKCNYKWSIHNFVRQQKRSATAGLKSANFSAGVNSKAQWYLHLLFDYSDSEYSNYFSSLLCYLKFVPSLAEVIQTQFRMCILDRQQSKVNMTQLLTHTFRAQNSESGHKIFSGPNMIVSQQLPNDTLTILCELFIFSKIAGVPRLKMPQFRLADDMGSLFETKKWSDVVITVGDQEVQAHKAILAIRSPVFAAMFDHQMEEQKNNRVDIRDIDLEVLNEMLRFVYTDKVMNLGSMADRLLAAADKYDLTELKLMCAKKLSESLAKNNAAYVLVIADVHSMDHLKMQAICFINANASDVISTDGYNSMVKSHPHLLDAIYRASVGKYNCATDDSPFFTIVEGASKL